MGKARHQNEDLTQKNVRTIAQMEEALDQDRSLGQRAADRFAKIVGSWTFLILQSILLAGWIALNLVAWHYRWDPYPFILLNLALSFQSAYAGPIIMMSQNRQGWLATRRNQLDLQINLLAEQESTEALRLLRRLCENAGINTDGDRRLQALERATRPEKLVQEIDRANKTEADPAT